MNNVELGPAQLRVFAAIPRSGSTVFMLVMANCPEAAVTSRNVLMGNMQPRAEGKRSRAFVPDYSLFFDSDHVIYKEANKKKASIVVSKEEMGNDRQTGTKTLNECNYLLFPDNKARVTTRPIFTFRHPHRVFDGWLKQNWKDVRSFILSYSSLINEFERCKEVCDDVPFYTYEFLTAGRENQTRVFRRVCEHWGLPYDAAILKLKPENFGLDFVYANERERRIYQEQREQGGLFDVLSESREIRRDILAHSLINDTHKRIIADAGILDAYERMHQACQRIYES